MKVQWYFQFSLLFVRLEPTFTKNTWMRTASVTVMVIFSNVPFWQFDHSYVQSSLSTIARHIDNGIWEILYSQIFYGSAPIYTFFYKQRFFWTQRQCCLTFSWIELQMLLRCCLIHITIIILRHILYLLYLCPCLDLDQFMSYICDLLFSFQPHFQCH